MIVFRNPGLIDLSAIRTLGVSVKVNDSPIGYFGTGLKFALATILRHGGEIVLKRGGKLHNISTVKETIRDEPFDIVTLDGERLGFTTQMGRDWQGWMAFRELASNAKDEGGSYHRAEDGRRLECGPEETVFVVEGAEIDESFAMRESIILEGQPLYESKEIEIFEGPSEYVFYRGVRIYRPGRPTALRYNILSTIELTEDRTAKWQFQVNNAIINGLIGCPDENLIRAAITCGTDNLEGNLEFTSYRDPTPEYTRLTSELALGHAIVPTLNPSITRKARTNALATMEPGDSIALDEPKKIMLDRARKMLWQAGFDIHAFPIIIVDTLGNGALGLAMEGKIFIALAAFDKGTREVAATLFEEYTHLRSGFGDCTRELQNWLFDQVLALVEKGAGEPF